VNIDDYPTIKRVFDQAVKLPAFQSTHPFLQPDAPGKLREEAGKLNTLTLADAVRIRHEQEKAYYVI
jgi:hypothetical protein